MADIIQAYAADIVKMDRDENGDLIVYGKATGPDLDLDEQRCDPGWLKKAMPDWMSWGNVREMHQPVVAGVGLELTEDGDSWFLKSKVVDANVATKLEAGAYKGQSIGIKNAKVLKDATAPGGRIVGGTIVEVSYVDRPCLPTATCAIVKMAGGELRPVDELGGLVELEPEATEPILQADAAKAAELTEAEREEVLDIIKAVNAKGQVDEKPDIADAKRVLTLLAKLIQAEAAEMAIGQLDESADISLLLDATWSMKCFLKREQAGLEGTQANDDVTSVFLNADADKSADADPTETSEAVSLGADEIKDLVKSAVAEATKAQRDELEAVRAELVKVKDTPIPGGPVITAPASARNDNARTEKALQASKFRRLADEVSDPELARYYREKAASLAAAA